MHTPSEDEPSVALALSDLSGLHAPMSARTGIKYMQCRMKQQITHTTAYADDDDGYHAIVVRPR